MTAEIAELGGFYNPNLFTLCPQRLGGEPHGSLKTRTLNRPLGQLQAQRRLGKIQP
jgi:hypothetical protein